MIRLEHYEIEDVRNLIETYKRSKTFFSVNYDGTTIADLVERIGEIHDRAREREILRKLREAEAA